MLKEKSYICFIDLEKAIDRLLKKMLEWTMRKKGIPDVLDRSVMSLYEGAESKLIMNCKRSLRSK